MSLYVTVHQFHCRWVHWNLARAEHKAIGNDRLAVDARKRLWSLIGQDGLFGHFAFVGQETTDRIDSKWSRQEDKATIVNDPVLIMTIRRRLSRSARA